MQELLVAQDLRGGEFFPTLAGQAVKAPQITTVGNGEAQVVDVPAGFVVHRKGPEVVSFPYFILRRAAWGFFS
jgi:hypothetical protein